LLLIFAFDFFAFDFLLLISARGYKAGGALLRLQVVISIIELCNAGTVTCGARGCLFII
jgi:hypothetical protein